jgi:hypothetical protein
MEKNDNQTAVEKPAQRLCSEIQLFDLCDLEVCIFKEGRFCRQNELLARFEHISDEDECAPVRRLSDELEADEDAHELGFGVVESDEDDEFGQREDEWEE